jgi:intracellular protein transport protein USO1
MFNPNISQEALILLVALTLSSTELQKLVTFENGFERIFSLIEVEGSLTHGSEVVEDCLSLLANLLRLNVSNQSYFRETGCVKRLANLLANATRTKQVEDNIPEWSSARRDKNLWGLLAIIQLFLVRGSINTSVNQIAFWQNGVVEQVLHIALSQGSNANITAKVRRLCLQ